MCTIAAEEGVFSATITTETQQQTAPHVSLNSPENTVTHVVANILIETIIVMHTIGSGGAKSESDVALLAGAVGGAGAILIIILLMLCVVIVVVVKMKKKGKHCNTTSKNNVSNMDHVMQNNYCSTKVCYTIHNYSQFRTWYIGLCMQAICYNIHTLYSEGGNILLL